MEGLSAKVFRTYNASHTFQQQLEKLTVKDATIPDKMLSFNRANRDVAVLCNHQRTASKSHGQQMERIQDRVSKRSSKLYSRVIHLTSCGTDPCIEIPANEAAKKAV